MNRILLITSCVCFFSWGFGQNCPLNSALNIPFSDTVKYELEVFDVVNNDLSAPNQALCSIDIDFDCNEISGLEMWLVSPGGDTVQLAGPVVITGSGGTLGSNWDITFLNDSITPTAQPDFPNDERFDHRVNRFSGGNYSGSYFPFQGSLQDFNSGPVNGQWQLILHLTPEFLEVEGSQVNDIHINFCDRRGYFCCFAEAGSLHDTSPLTACTTDSSLSLLDLSVSFPNGPADSTLYSYTYILTQADTILAYDSLPDPTQLPPGSYQIYGFSYQTDQRDSFPPANSNHTLTELRDSLLSDLPPFCGSITNDSKALTILPTPDTTFLGTQTICSGESLIIAGSRLDSAGAYLLDTLAANGCDSIIQVELILKSLSRDTIIETTCDTGPFSSSTGETLDSTGFYTFTYTTTEGCDSVVVVDFRNYSITPVITTSADAITCRDSVITLDGTASTTGAGRFTYRWEAPPFGQVISTDSVVQIDQPGTYRLQLIHEQSCPPIQTSVTIGDERTPPEAAVASAPPITCTDSIVQISGQALAGSSNYAYQWISSGALILDGSDSLIASVHQPGNYQFILTDMANGCRDTALIQVNSDTIAPVFSLSGNDTLDCNRSELSPVINLINPAGNYTYEWRNSQDQLIPQGNTNTPTITVADTFQVSVTNTDNGCTYQDQFISRVDTLAPVARIASPDLLDCQVREIELRGSSSQPSDEVEIAWTAAAGGNIIAGENTLHPDINTAGDYILSLTNTRNGCQGSAQVSVQDTSSDLTANIVQENILTCQQQSTVLSSSGSSAGPNIQYSWTDLDHGTFSGQAGNTVTINRPGRYQLLVQDTFTNCLEVFTLTTIVDTLPPAVLTGAPAQLDCNTTQVILGDAASAQNPNLQYTWRGPCLLSRSDSIQVIVDCTGAYTLTVFNTSNSCQASKQVQVSRDTTTPTAIVADTVAIDCSTGLAFLDGSASFGGQLEWFYEGKPLNTYEDSLLVADAGQYTLRVSNPTLQCTDEQTITVTTDCKPEAVILTPDSLDCQNTSVALDARNSKGEALDYRWRGPGGSNCFVSADSSSVRIMVTCPGTYQLIVTNRVVNESDTAEVLITEDINLPIAEAGPDIDLSCAQPVSTREALTTGNPAEALYRWNTPLGITLSNQPGFDFNTGGSYVLEVENPLNNCIRRDTLIVTEPEVPSIEIRVPEVLNCADSSVRLDPLIFTDESLLSYRWKGRSGQVINTPDQGTIEVSEPGIYQLTVTDTLSQCRSTDSIEVLLDRMIPPAEAGLDTSLNCNTPQLALNGKADAPDRPLEYLWLSERPNGIASGKNTLNPTVQDTGTYQLVVLDLRNGCLASDSLRVLPPRPLPNLTSLEDSSLTCTNAVLTLSAPIRDTLPYLISWTGLTDTGLPIDTSSGAVFLAEAPGSYTLTVRDKQTACTATQTLRVSIDTLRPAFTLQNPDTLSCQQTEVSLRTSNPLDSSRFSFNWASDNGADIGQELPLTIRTPGRYTLTVKDQDNGCESEESVLVQEQVTRPELSLPAAPELTCRDDTITLRVDAAASVQASWTGPTGGLISEPGTLEAIVHLPGTYQIQITDPATGCTNQSAVTVNENKTPPSLSVDTSRNYVIGCVQTSVTLDASQVSTSSGAPASYQWTSTKGTGTESSLTVEIPQTVRLQVTDTQNGCTTNYNFIVRQDQEQPRFTLEADGTLGCGNNTVQLTAQFRNNIEGVELAWSANGTGIDAQDSSISVQDTGKYLLRSTNPANGCSFEQEIQVMANPAIPILNITVDTSLECTIDQVRLSAQSVNYPPQALRYSWRTADGVLQGNTSGTSIFASEQGIYRLTALHPSSGCEAQASGTVIRRGRRIEALEFTLRPNDCDPDGGGRLAIASVSGGTAPYFYDFNGSGLEDKVAIEIAQAGSYSLAVEDINGCRLDTVLNLSMNEFPIVDLGQDIILSEGDSTRLKVQISSEQYERLEWIEGNTVITTDSREIVVAPRQSTAYTVRTITAEGCIFTDQLWVFVEETPLAYLPTAFSPNDDGINDRFLPGFSPRVTRINQFYIYDRWGNTVHAIQDTTPNDLQAGWDGRHREQASPAAVYVYWLEVEVESGEKKQWKGEVLLIK